MNSSENEKYSEKTLQNNTEQLIQAHRLNAIGELSARIAHDLRNPLMIIKPTVHCSTQASGVPCRTPSIQMSQHSPRPGPCDAYAARRRGDLEPGPLRRGAAGAARVRGRTRLRVLSLRKKARAHDRDIGGSARNRLRHARGLPVPRPAAPGARCP